MFNLISLKYVSQNRKRMNNNKAKIIKVDNFHVPNAFLFYLSNNHRQICV